MALPSVPTSFGPEVARCEKNDNMLNEAPVSTKKLFPVNKSCTNIKFVPVANYMAVTVAGVAMAGGGGGVKSGT
jgi:hypothetical protein